MHTREGLIVALAEAQRKREYSDCLNIYVTLQSYGRFPPTVWPQHIHRAERSRAGNRPWLGALTSHRCTSLPPAKAIHDCPYPQRVPRGERPRACATQLSPPGFPWATIAVQGPSERQQRIMIISIFRRLVAVGLR